MNNTRRVSLTDTNTNTFIANAGFTIPHTRMLVGDRVGPALDERASPTGIRRVRDERDHRHSGAAHEHDQPADLSVDSEARWFATPVGFSSISNTVCTSSFGSTEYRLGCVYC